jgi:N-acetylglucosaminyl-diphospho-decaprenol L-rhamnosyltransferase
MSTCIGSAIVVTHCSRNCIEVCLQALTNQSGWEIFVIDNASNDDTAELVRRLSPGVRVVANPENIGFAAAVNQGVRVAQGDLVLILNPDCVANPGALDRLAEAFADPNVMALGGMLVDLGGQPQKGFTVRRFPTLGRVFAEIFLLNRIWPSNTWNRRYRCLDLDYAKQQDVEQPAGACLAFRREVWERIGGFDEAFFPVWFEDVDFCRRIHDAGLKILYSPKVLFTHAGAHSVGQLPYAQRQLYWYANLQRYFKKHHSALALGVLRAGILVGLVFRSFLALVGAKPDGVGRWEAVRGYAQVVGSAYQTWRSRSNQ